MVASAHRTGIVVLLASTAPVFAGEAQIVAAKDNTLYEEANGALSNGSGSYLFAGVSGQGRIHRGLLFFDVAAQVPAGVEIVSARLTLSLSMTQTGPSDVALHVLQQDWGEGASNAPSGEGGGAPSAPGDATWLHTFHPGSTWTNTGGDFAPTSSAVQVMDFFGPYVWGSTPEMVFDVQSWLDDPASNFGWLLRGIETQFGSKRFGSRNHPASSQWPMLEVTWADVLTYCTGKTTSTGCIPFMTTSGAASTTSTAPFFLRANDALVGEAGFVFYGSKKSNVNFHGGKMCVKPPIHRLHPAKFANPGGAGTCGGLMKRDFNARIQLGSDPTLTAGATVFAQWYQRDPLDPFGTGDALSDAVRFVVCP